MRNIVTIGAEALLVLLIVVAAFMVGDTYGSTHLKICHTQAQTNCLWVDGTSEWK